VAPRTTCPSDLDVEHWGERFRLTPRERDVVRLLASGHSTIASIAAQLELSENTVHNHFKNIFRRTRTHSKADLLALLLGDRLERVIETQALVRRPAVLLCNRAVERSRALGDALRERGMRVRSANSAAEIGAMLDEHRTDVVVIDAVACSGADLAGLREFLRARRGHPAAVLVATSELRDTHPWIAEGGTELIECESDTLDIDRIVFAVLEQFVDSPYERNRLVRVPSDLPADLDGRRGMSVENIGFGGAFVSLTPTMSGPSIGNRVDLRLDLDRDGHVAVSAEVRWRREGDPNAPTGIGVHFVDVTPEDQDRIETFVRGRRARGPLPWPTQSARESQL
jgi:DNA-binding NarL/FixJ family response regulator